MASEKAIEVLKNASTKVDPSDRQMLGKIARKHGFQACFHKLRALSKIVVDAVIAVAEKADGHYKVDIDNKGRKERQEDP